MKIHEITDDEIIFDNGEKLTYYHDAECCETNFADFSQLEDTGIELEEFEDVFPIEFIDGYGIRICSKKGNWYSIPCYSMQNGYYSCELTIYIKRKNKVLYRGYLSCELVDR